MIIDVKGIELETGNTVFQAYADLGAVPFEQCYNKSEGKIYGVFYDEFFSSFDFGTIDYSGDNPQVNVIAHNFPAVTGMAFDANGQLWGVERLDDGNNTVTGSRLVKIDHTTGAVTAVGDTGLVPTFLSDGAIDTKTGYYYYTVCTENGAWLASIDFATGAASKLYDFSGNEQVIGVYVETPLAEPGAPAVVQNMYVDYEPGALTGTVKFTSPTQLFDGSAGSGALTYHIYVDKVEVSSGSTSFGAAVEAPVTVSTDGYFTVSARVSNSEGLSPQARQTVFFGSDELRDPYYLDAYYSDGKFTFYWAEDIPTVNGGYVNRDDITYTIRQVQPYEQVLFEGLTGITATYDFPMPSQRETYQFALSAQYHGKSTGEALSYPLAVGIGQMSLPYSQDFEDYMAMDEFILVDGNGDTQNWSIMEGRAVAPYSYMSDMDDWMITQPAPVEAGKLYTVKFKTWCQDATIPERLEVKWGNGPSPDQLTNTLMPVTEINVTPDAPMICEYAVVPQEDGMLCIGFHGLSVANSYWLSVDDLEISAGMEANVPDAATDFTGVTAPDGSAQVTLSFTAPTKDMSGGDLASLAKMELSRDGELIKTFTDVAPGAKLSYVDTPSLGNHTYSLVAYNAGGAGLSASLNIFCGVGLPAAPANVAVTETAKPGTVTVTWDPVTANADGQTIDSSAVKYNVYSFDGKQTRVLGTDLTGTSVEGAVVDAGAQSFVQITVAGVTDFGEGEGTLSRMLPVGVPYDGLSESFSYSTLSHVWSIKSNGANASIFSDASGIVSQDKDDGFLAFMGEYLGDSADFISGKVTVPTISPALTLWLYKMGTDDVNTL